MRAAKILAITEVDVTVPMTIGGADAILTSILRGRKADGKPTIITLTRSCVVFDRPRVGEIYNLVDTKHNVDEMVVRIMMDGGVNDEEH